MWKKQKRNNKIDNKFYMKMQYILLKKEERILKMTLKLVQDFLDNENKYRYFYNAANAITIFLLVFVFINKFHSFIDVKNINTFMPLAQMIDGVSIQILILFILLKIFNYFIIRKTEKNKNKIILLTICDLLDIFIRLLVIVELASMLIVSKNNFNLIFYIIVIIYYFCLILSTLFIFNRNIVILPDLSILYFDSNNKKLHLDDYVIYKGCLYEIKKRNDKYYICRDKDRIDYRVTIPLEEALSDSEGKLIFHQHGIEKKLH